jgi:hypothetical protein
MGAERASGRYRLSQGNVAGMTKQHRPDVFISLFSLDFVSGEAGCLLSAQNVAL